MHELDGRAEDHAPTSVHHAGVDDFRRAEPSLDLHDSPFDEALLLLRRVILRVLSKVSVRARFRDCVNDSWVAPRS